MLHIGLNNLRKVLVVSLLSALVLTAGCTSEEARSVAGVENGKEAGGEDAFSVDLTLCRKVSRKSGRPIGENDEFSIAAKSYVNALVDFNQVKPGRPYVVHLVWVRPDGRELYRKYAQVQQFTAEPGQYRTEITWLDATDLHDIKRETLSSDFPGFTLDSRFNISTARERETGKYAFHVYLDRRLLMTRDFLVIGDEDPGS